MTTHNSTTKLSNSKGFTLVETLVALSLSVLIVLGTTQVFINGLRHINGVRAQALLTSDAGYMVQMIRNELFGADGITVNSPDSVDIEQGSDTQTFSITNGQLMLDGITPITREGVTVTNLLFEEVGRSLRIQFTLTSGPRTNKTFSGTTTLALRN
jgi:prepilin-type N-terminal cleavage/methylation domain-containing protein